MIHAPRGEGKTYFALSVGKALAGCHDLLGWTCSNYGRVLFVDGELPGAALQQRLGRFQRSPPGAFHILGRDAFLLRKKMIPDLGAPEGRQELDRIIEKCKPDLVILDSLSTLVRSGIENDAESWSEVQQWLLKHRWAGRTMLLVHHEGKSSGRQRGTSKREDVLDTVISLRKNAEESTTTESVFDLTFTKARDFYGEAADPMRLRLAVEEGQLIWRHEKIRDVQRERVREMMDAGMKGKDIAKELDLTPGRVSQIVKEIKLEGNVVAFPGRKDEQTLVPEKV
jgi:putative DNA primase/helicase